jgi:ABC-type nickel/cobalt efflux system permease component RcnA
MTRLLHARPVRALAVTALTVTALAVLAGVAPAAGAHPLGNFTINHHLGLVVAPTQVQVDYVVDHAEIPTFQERAALDADGDGTVSAREAAAYATLRCGSLGPGIALRIGGAESRLVPAGAAASLPLGPTGLETLRVECSFQVELPGFAAGDRLQVEVEDRNQADRIGWREMVARGAGVDLVTDLPAQSPTDRLRRYPEGVAIASVPRVLSASLTGTVTDPTARPEAPALAAGEPAVEDGAGTSDPFTALLARADAGWAAALAAVGFAALLGGLHGLAPGHGKTVVAAYLVGTRGNRRQAAGLAAAVAASHTLGVVVLGAVTLAASAAFPLERLYGALQAISALIVAGLGVTLTHRAIVQHHRRSRLVSASAAVVRPDHGHRHDHDHDHHDHHGHHEHGHHEHDHGHDHGHHDHHGHDHGHHDYHEHDHGLLGHRHRFDLRRIDVTRALSWRELAALGLSGGLVPSASAVIVLLGAIQLGRPAFGGALILAFGLGLAAALVGVGLGIVAVTTRSRRYLDAHAVTERLSALLGPAAAVAVLAVGLWLAVRAGIALT